MTIEHDDLSFQVPKVGVAPEENRREAFRRFRRSLTPQYQIALLYLMPLAILGVIVFAMTANRLSAHEAFDILIGASGSADTDGGLPAAGLAAVGYLIIPGLASVLIASVWPSSQTGR